MERYAGTNNMFMIEEPATPKAGGVWLGAVLPRNISKTVENTREVPAGEKGAGTFRSVLALTEYTPGTPFTYYTGFGWEKWGGWTAESFAAYLANFDAALKTPFTVEIK
jgi:hypothetical protein